MKILILALSISLTASARQYIQCRPADSFSTNGIVLNLNDTQSTLLRTNGVQIPDEDRNSSLVNIQLMQAQENFTTYKSEEGELIQIPNEFIGQYSNHFNINIFIDSTKSSYSCFSSIYND